MAELLDAYEVEAAAGSGAGPVAVMRKNKPVTDATPSARVDLASAGG
jgi:hypothetical protein